MRSDNGQWDLWKEREFIENLAIERLNFLMVFAGLVVAGVTASSNNRPLQYALISIGIAVSSLVGIVVFKAFTKVDDILDRLQGEDKNTTVVDHWTKSKCKIRGFSNIIQGIVLPLLFLFMFIILLIVAPVGK